MIKAYDEIGTPTSFGGITIQLVALTRRPKLPVPEGAPYGHFKLGYKFVSIDPYTSIDDIHRFVRWQLEFEKTARYLDEEGNVIDERPNSLWEEKHLQPLLEILETVRAQEKASNQETLKLSDFMKLSS